MNKNYEYLYVTALKLSSEMVKSEAKGADYTLVDNAWGDLTDALIKVEREHGEKCKAAWEKVK